MFFKLTITGCLWASAVASRVTDFKEEGIDLDCKPLESIIYCENPAPQRQGAGGFAQTWLVKVKKTGSMEILKTFFKSRPGGEEHLPKRYLTIGDYVHKPREFETQLLTTEARAECHFASKLHDAHRKREGSKYVMDCLGTNLDFDPNADTTPRNQDEPLWSLLSNCGHEDLSDFMRRIVLDKPDSAPSIFRNIYKQILLGLDALANTFKVVLVHHDLKPENIMVKNTIGPDGREQYRAYIIDLGSTLGGSKDVCRDTAVTPQFTPAEHRLERATCRNRVQSFDPEHPWAFDIFSVAMVWIESLTGADAASLANLIQKSQCISLITTVCLEKSLEDRCKASKTFCSKLIYDENKERMDHGRLQALVEDGARFTATMMSVLKDSTKARFPFVEEVMTDPNAESFLHLLLRALRVKPEERPNIQDLLAHPWMDKTHLDSFDMDDTQATHQISRD